MRTRFQLPAIALLLLAPLAARAQATVHGTVMDAQTRAPVAGAMVVLTGTEVGTETDPAGAFTLTSPDSITSLVVSATGYVGDTVRVADASRAIVVRLTAAHQRLPGIEVTAHLPTPSTVDIPQPELERASGLSLEQSINTEPGLFMQSRTPWGGARITIRGYYPSTNGNSPNSNGLGNAGLSQRHPDHGRDRAHDPRRRRLRAARLCRDHQGSRVEPVRKRDRRHGAAQKRASSAGADERERSR